MSQSRRQMGLLRFGWVTVVVLAAALVVALWLKPAGTFDPPWLLPPLNLVFLTVIPLIAAWRAVATYRITGVMPALALGAGMLAIAVGGGIVPAILNFTGGPNQIVTMHNSSVLLAGIFQLLAAAGTVLAVQLRRRDRYVVVAYGAVLVIVALLLAAILAGSTPVFFVAGHGPTPVRQVVLGSAAAIFAAAALIWWPVSRANADMLFLRWYVIGLTVFAVGLVAVLQQTVVGGLVGWVGRAAQYLGSIYLLITVLQATHGAVRHGHPVSELGVSLFQSTLPYRQLVESTSDAVVALDRHGRVLYWNDAASEMLGYASDEVFGENLVDLIVLASDRHSSEADLERVLSPEPGAGAGGRVELTLVARGGRPLTVELAVYGSQADRGLVVWAIRDVTERRAAERAVREREAHLRELVEDLGAIVWERDPVTLGTLYVSHGAETILGYPLPQWTERPSLWMDLIHPDDREATIAALRAAVEARRDFVQEYRAEAADGRTVWLRGTGHVVIGANGEADRLRGVSVDISDAKRLEVQVLRSQRLEAVGQLAGGIAHDFNNLLTAIRGYAELLRRSLPSDDERSHADLDQVVLAADRAAALTRQLLAFSRRQVLAPEVLEPAAIVEGIAPMLRRLLGEHIELTTRAASGLGRVKVDPSQLEQVLVNLAVNAGDALPDGGRLTIETANVELGPEYAAGHPEAIPGPYVLLAVSDTGVGMDAATRAHIFEPFFTTKEPGKGTGMGLATVYGIIKQSGGSIYVYSEPGRGTTFKIYLPRVLEEPSAAAPVTLAARLPSSGTETILLVEDEPAVRGFARRALEDRGYTVLEAAGGAEALAIAASSLGPIALLVTDVIMPGLQGHQLAATLAAVRPELRILYVSGFTENSVIHHGVPDHGVAFLPKPFSAEELGAAVRHVLDGPA